MSILKTVTSLEQQTKTKLKQNKAVVFDTSKTRLYKSSDRWTIVYYIYNSDLEKLERKQIKISSKEYPDLSARDRYAQKRMYELNSVLKAGYYIGNNEFGQKVEPARLVINSLYEVLEVNTNFYKDRSKESFKTTITHLATYLKRIGKSDMILNHLDKLTIIEFRDYLATVCNCSNRTINGYIGYLSAFFSYMMDREWIEKNPFKSIKNLKIQDTITNRAWDHDEISIIFTELKKTENLPLHFFCLLIFYMWLRPREISLLKVGDINLDTWKIKVSATNAKNSKLKVITIPLDFRNFVESTGIRSQNKNLFVFGLLAKGNGRFEGGLFGTVNCADNLFAKYFATIRKKLNISIEVKMYGLKRNGCKNAAINGVSIHAMQQHGRWSSLDEVDTYLKKSGVNIFEETEINKMTGIKTIV